MSPVPEPMQGDRENPRNGEDEGINPPAGLMMGPPMSSSDEEPDQVDSEDPNLSGYQPLPQDFVSFTKEFNFYIVSVPDNQNGKTVQYL